MKKKKKKKDNDCTAMTYLCDGCPKLRADGTCTPTYGECPEYESFFDH